MPDAVEITRLPGTDPRVAVLVGAYGDELIGRAPWIESRVRAWDVGAEEFLVASVDGVDVGCVALVTLDGSTAEVRRMFVTGDARRTGVGRRLLRGAEEEAAARGATRVVLDTMRVLTEAVALYRTSGYAEIDAYNANPAADLWFAKPLPA